MGQVTFFFFIYMSYDIDVRTGCIVGSALCTKETLPDFRE